MKKRFHRKWFLFLALFAVMFLVPSVKAQAANPTKVTLKPNTRYTAYDITGDQKADTITIKATKNTRYNMYENASVVVNGKTIRKFSGYCYHIYATLYTLSNKKPFLYLYNAADNGDGPVCGVFQYTSGKLKQIINFQTIFKNYGGHLNGNVLSVSGKTMTVECSVMSWTVGPSNYSLKYKYSNGTLVRASSLASSIDMSSLKSRGYTYVTAARSFTVYTSTSLNKVAFTLKKGQKVKFTGAYIKSGKHYLKVTMSNGKTGWIKCLTAYPYNVGAPFAEVGYAG